MALLGTGVAITFGTSAFVGKLIGAPSGSESRAEVETTHHQSGDSKGWMPGDHVDRGTVDVEIEFDPDTPPPIDAPPETITITFRTPTGKTGGATISGLGFLTQANWTAPLEDRMTGGYTLRWSGKPTKTPATSGG